MELLVDENKDRVLIKVLVKMVFSSCQTSYYSGVLNVTLSDDLLTVGYFCLYNSNTEFVSMCVDVWASNST